MVLAGCGPLIPNVEVLENYELLSHDDEGRLYCDGTLFSGYVTAYYANGVPKSRHAYRNGLLEATSYGYYPSGETMYIRPYAEGEKHGEHLGFYPDGTKKFSYLFSRGYSIGNHKEWYASGQLAKELNYVNGQPFGPQKMWREDGKIRSNYVIREDGRRYGLVGLKRCKNIDTELEQISKLTSAIYDK